MARSPDHPMLFLAHRGARLSTPENTLAAFELALEHGCDGFEFDVRQTRDGRAVLCHGPRLHRRAIAESSFADLADRCGAAGLTCLEDVLAAFQARAFLDIELKVAGLEEQTVEALGRSPPQRGFVVSSFLPEVVRELRRLAPELPTGFIFDRGAGLAAWEKVDPDVVIPHRALATVELTARVHARGKRIFVWTVNSERDLRRFAEMGVDAVISDETGRLADEAKKLTPKGTKENKRRAGQMLKYPLRSNA